MPPPPPIFSRPGNCHQCGEVGLEANPNGLVPWDADDEDDDDGVEELKGEDGTGHVFFS